MNARAVVFAMLGLFVSMGLTTWWMANDLQKARAKTAANRAALGLQNQAPIPATAGQVMPAAPAGQVTPAPAGEVTPGTQPLTAEQQQQIATANAQANAAALQAAQQAAQAGTVPQASTAPQPQTSPVPAYAGENLEGGAPVSDPAEAMAQ